MLRQIFEYVVVILLLGPWSQASVLSTDTIYVSTLTGTASSQGVQISSYVNLAPNTHLTLTGSTGYILGGSSITASAFFGDGSALSGADDSLRRSTQTFSGSNIFISSVSVQSTGVGISLSTGPTTSNISISSNGVVTFFPFIHTGSMTVIPNYTTTATKLGPCVTGSTLTLNTTGSRLEIKFTGTIINDNSVSGSTAAIGISFLQDGQFVRDLNADKAIAGYSFPQYTGSDKNIQRTVAVSYLLDAPAAGSHSFCLTINAPFSGNSTLYNDSTVSNVFYVTEIK